VRRALVGAVTMKRCTICGEGVGPGERAPGREPSCPECGPLWCWFLGHYAEVEFIPEEGWITAETTFLELSVESLDYVEWVIEAEEQFGVTIPDREAEGMRTVGDYLRYLRFRGKAKGRGPAPWRQDPLWDERLDG
jgi:acyl carrier protein